MRGKLSINPELRGIRVIVTNAAEKTNEEITTYAQTVLDRNGFKQYKVYSIEKDYREEGKFKAHAMVP